MATRNSKQKIANDARNETLRRSVSLTGQLAEAPLRAGALESVFRAKMVGVSYRILQLGYTTLVREGIKPLPLYVERLQRVETNSFAGKMGAPRTAFDLDLDTITWRGLQRVQFEHDMHYHHDVVGRTNMDHLQHILFHLAKINGHLADAIDAIDQNNDDTRWLALTTSRIPDLMLFGVKANTCFQVALDNSQPAAAGFGEQD